MTAREYDAARLCPRALFHFHSVCYVERVRSLIKRLRRKLSADPMLPENSPNHTSRQSFLMLEPPVYARRSGMLPQVAITVVEQSLGYSFVYPNPWLQASGRAADIDNVVCEVGFGVSPLGDCVYVSDLKVDQPYRRRGYASALLAEVALYAGGGSSLPITPLHISNAAYAFWAVLRQEARSGLLITRDVRFSEMEAEQERWRHLRPIKSST